MQHGTFILMWLLYICSIGVILLQMELEETMTKPNWHLMWIHRSLSFKSSQEVCYNLFQLCIWLFWDLSIGPIWKQKQISCDLGKNSMTNLVIEFKRILTRLFKAYKKGDISCVHTWLCPTGLDVGWWRETRKHSQILWSCWAPACQDTPWHPHR